MFGASGTWTLALDEVRDATGCAASLADQPALRLDVVETAGIAPASTRTDYCVGEQIDYVLQGMPPWTVHYTFNGRERRATSRQAATRDAAARRRRVTARSWTRSRPSSSPRTP